MNQKILVKEDKNGTKYYHNVCTCMKCGGSGFISCYVPINGGECFDCWGSGIVEYETKEYTPEYEAKLEARRQARFEKKKAAEIAKSAERNQEFFEKHGFNSDGNTYVVLGNTYSIKEELKELGCKFDNVLGWHSPVKLDKYPSVEISVDDVYYKDYTETYSWKNWKENETYSAKIEAAKAELNKTTSNSEWVSEVGEKVELNVIFKRVNWFETQFGESAIYSFEDENGNQIIWKTGTYLDVEQGSKISIKGTVKEHSEYRGVKQTVLTRCKVC